MQSGIQSECLLQAERKEEEEIQQSDQTVVVVPGEEVSDDELEVEGGVRVSPPISSPCEDRVPKSDSMELLAFTLLALDS